VVTSGFKVEIENKRTKDSSFFSSNFEKFMKIFSPLTFQHMFSKLSKQYVSKSLNTTLD